MKKTVKQIEVTIKIRNEIVPSDGNVSHEVQTVNKFAALEVKDDDQEANSHLTTAEESIVQQNSRNYQTKVGGLNSAAAVFTPKPIEIESKIETNTNSIGKRNEAAEGIQKESTAQWVNRTFVDNLVQPTRLVQQMVRPGMMKD